MFVDPARLSGRLHMPPAAPPYHDKVSFTPSSRGTSDNTPRAPAPRRARVARQKHREQPPLASSHVIAIDNALHTRMPPDLSADDTDLARLHADDTFCVSPPGSSPIPARSDGWAGETL